LLGAFVPEDSSWVYWYETVTLGTCRNRGVQHCRAPAQHLILKLSWHYLLPSLHPSFCVLLLPDHHLPQTTLIVPAAPPFLAVTCGTRGAGGRGRWRLSLSCCWRAQQGKPQPWVLPTRSVSHRPQVMNLTFGG